MYYVMITKCLSHQPMTESAELAEQSTMKDSNQMASIFMLTITFTAEKIEVTWVNGQ